MESRYTFDEPKMELKCLKVVLFKKGHVLSLQAMVFLYNAWVIPLRAVFPFAETSRNVAAWFVCDYIGDLIYLLDMFVYKRRLMFMENGFWVKNKKRLSRRYVTEGTFKYDLTALIPLEFLYFVLGVNATYLR